MSLHVKCHKNEITNNYLLQIYFSGQMFILSDSKQVSQRKSASNKRSNPIQSEMLQREEMWVMIRKSITVFNCTAPYWRCVRVCVRSLVLLLMENRWKTSAAPFSHALCLFKVTSEKGICIGKRNSECDERRV